MAVIDFPANPAVNDEFTSSSGLVYVWNGQGWLVKTSAGASASNISVSDDPPPTPSQGDMWLESDTLILWCWYQDPTGGQWVQVNGATIVTGGGGVTQAYVDSENQVQNDAVLAANVAQNTAINGKVSKAGDTMTGNLHGPGGVFSATGTYFPTFIGFSGNPQQGLHVYCPADGQSTILSWGGGAYWPLSLYGSLITLAANIRVGGTDNFWQTDGALQISNNGYKPGGGAWATTSDARIKTVRAEYSRGLNAINQLKPVHYSYKNNASLHDAETPMHKDVVNREFIGLVAQQVETIIPELVTKVSGYIDGQPVDDLRMLDPSALTYALINAVNELTVRIKALEAKR